MTGKIIKGISGFYYVHVAGSGIYECKAKGVFRQQNIKPLVGDDVCIDVLDEEKRTGNLVEILARRNELVRPAVANIDLAVLIFAASFPEPNFNLLDRFLLVMQFQKVPVTLCFNKIDLVKDIQIREIKERYAQCGCSLLFTSASENSGIEPLLQVLEHKTTAVAGPSGVGKSSLINLLVPEAFQEIGEISKKIGRGKHTTRHTELIPINSSSYIMDTPGFSSLAIPGLNKEDLRDYFPEFIPFEPQCRFQGCQHMNEPDCGVKEAVAQEKIAKGRYENYVLFYNELKDLKLY
ncbi:MAG: ribosome small subunit-dependent GTPase A [Lachnospiraceae bacterium]